MKTLTLLALLGLVNGGEHLDKDASTSCKPTAEGGEGW